MAIEHLKHESNGRTFKVTQDGQDTGQRAYKSFIGQKNVNLGGGNFAPYVWDGQSQSIRYGNHVCEFDVDGFQTVREFGSVETLIDDQRFELQYWRTQGGGSWRVLDLYQVGLTVNQQDNYCIVTRTLSDKEDPGDPEEEGNTLDVDFLFKPKEKVKLTFRLHGVNTTLTYRIRFQNSGIAGEVTEVPFIEDFGQGANLGIHKLLFDNIKFEWNSDEINLHSYTIEDQAGGKKLDVFISDFILDANGDVVISPDTWGPITTSDDCVSLDGTYMDDNGGLVGVGNLSDYEVDVINTGLIFSNVVAEGTAENGCKITCTASTEVGNGCDATLSVSIDNTPTAWGVGFVPEDITPESATIAWDQETGSGSFDSPEIKTLAQDRFDGSHNSGDDMAFSWIADQPNGQNFQEFDADDAELTLVYTPAAAGWTGIINGITNPAKINGIAVANIKSVMGVE